MNDLSSVVTYLQTIDSPTVANAIESFGVRALTEGYASMDLVCRFSDLPPSVGYAVTCVADSTSEKPADPNRLAELFDAVVAAPKPAVVVIQHRGPDRLKSCFAGDVLCSCLQKLGVIALVTDGGVRDLKGIQARVQGFQVFAAGTVVSHGTASIVEVGGVLSICGLTVRPGDLIHGDDNGLLTVPIETANQKLVDQIRVVQQKEKEFLAFLKTDPFSLQEMKARLGH